MLRHSAAAVTLPPSDRTEVAVQWLVGLRWGAVLGQIAVIAVVHFGLGTPLPLARLLSLVGITAITNAALAVANAGGAWRSPTACGVVLLIDVAMLTGMLHATGGPLNPFSIFYIVHITLAAAVLGAGWTWTVTALSVACFGGLFWLYDPSVGMEAHHMHGDGALSSHLRGMWIAFLLTASLTAYFVVRLSAALERREAELVATREQSSRYEKLASLTTLAAGAAHELGTPLATIAVVATEAERLLAGLPVDAAERMRTDVRLIRTEVSRCRRILDAMAADAGGPQGEIPTDASVRALLDDAVAGLSTEARGRVQLDAPTADAQLTVPRQAVGQTLANIVRNALEGSSGPVWLAATVDAARARFVIRDHGPGMAPDILARCTEPFFSTKPPGQGMGLGLFLAKTLAEHLGGALTIDSAPGSGTEVGLALPLNRLQRQDA